MGLVCVVNVARPFGADDLARVDPFEGNAGLSEAGGQDARGEEFSEALDGVEAGGTQLAQQADALRDAAQRAEERIALVARVVAAVLRQQLVNDGVVALLELVDEGAIGIVAAGGAVVSVQRLTAEQTRMVRSRSTAAETISTTRLIAVASATEVPPNFSTCIVRGIFR